MVEEKNFSQVNKPDSGKHNNYMSGNTQVYLSKLRKIASALLTKPWLALYQEYPVWEQDRFLQPQSVFV